MPVARHDDDDIRSVSVLTQQKMLCFFIPREV